MRISIKISLMVGMALSVGFLVGQAAMAVSMLRQVHTTNTAIATDWLPSVRVLGEINLHATRYRLRAARHVMNVYDTHVPEIEAQLAEEAAQLQQDFASYEPLISDEGERRAWTDFRGDWNLYTAAQDEVLAASRRGDKVRAAEIIEESRDLFLGAIAKLTREIDTNNGYVAAATVAAEQTYARALIAVVALAVIAVIFGLAVWRFVVVTAATALDRLIGAMKSIAAGDFGTAIPSRERRDEIGDMAQTLVVFRDGLAEAERLRAEQAALDLANLRLMREAEQNLSALAERLDAEVTQKTRDLAEREREIIWRLSRATERRDSDTGDHIARMARIAGLVAEAMGLPDADRRLIELAAQMHDIGKVGIPDDILFKPGAFMPDERRVMETHALLGWDILKGSESRLIQMAADVAVSHHEKWDGSGYPRGLAGEAIPLCGRIAAVADVFDALLSRRAYKAEWPIEEARAYIADNAGRHFDPACVDAFFARWDEIAAIAGVSASEVAASASAAA
ncbi:HD domain-containing protein [Siculibacillus lacustris]|uniref:HD domain-containing protein n=1 Tax=Siculibacillus lacustris TaxID=1549641 RepID=A0A4Q9VYA3_9HYPH|nr:HD domain-containing phosphohydrolase [Siculibacillus lacustris]TBW41390.1 HD domain-containing protein [Siculibacillus lacustris]